MQISEIESETRDIRAEAARRAKRDLLYAGFVIAFLVIYAVGVCYLKYLEDTEQYGIPPRPTPHALEQKAK